MLLDTVLRYACPGAAAIAAVTWSVGERRWLRAVSVGLLIFSVVGGLWVYTGHHRRTRTYFNAYEQYHYALPTRYAAELGYTGLYEATVAALLELPRAPRLPEKIRDLTSGRLVKAEVIIARAPSARARFSDARWQEFRADTAWFATRMGPATVARVLGDKGYNASPVYGAVAGTFTSRLEAGSPGFLALPWIDVALLSITLGFIAWIFGLRSAAFVLAMLVTYSLTSHSHQKAALLRLDWICALLLSLCALKRQRFATAGALTAYAAAIRIFPAIFGFAMLVRLVDVAVRERRLAKGPAAFLAAAAATGLGAVAVTLPTVGLDGWRAFFEKILMHNAQLTGWRVGLKYLFLGTWDGHGWAGLSPAVTADRLGIAWALVVLAALGLAALVMRRLDDVEAHAFGFAVAFVLIAPTYYYWILVLIPTLACAARIESRSHAIGLSLLFVGGIVGHLLLDGLGRDWGTFYAISLTLLVFVGWWTAASLRSRPRVPYEGLTGQPMPVAAIGDP